MKSLSKIKKNIFKIFLSLALINLNVSANSSFGSSVPVTQNLEVSVGLSQIIKLKDKPERLALSNPGIAYVLMLAPDQIQIIGRNPGRTNLFLWFPPAEGSKPGTPSKVIGAEISVGLPKPAYITSTPSIQIINGDYDDNVVIGNPPERIRNSRPGRTSGPATDMPEPCLSPGCL